MSLLFASRIDAAASSIPSSVSYLRTDGYYAPADGGGSLYTRLGAAPSPAKPWHFQSADGAWWMLSERTVNVRMFGAQANGVHDDGADFNSADEYLKSSSGGVIQVPPGIYRIDTPIVLGPGSPFNAVSLEGASQYSTILNSYNNDITVLTVNSGFCRVQNLGIQSTKSFSATTFPPTKPAFKIDSGGASARIRDCWIIGGTSCIDVAAGDCIFDGVSTGGCINDQMICHDNTAGLRVNNSAFDQNYPVSTPPPGVSFVAWAPATRYEVGDLVVIGAYVCQCKTAGMSGSSAPALKNLFQDMSEAPTGGTAVWNLVMAVNKSFILIHNATEILLDKVDLSGAAYFSVTMQGASALLHMTDCILSPLRTCINCISGAQIQVTGCEIFGPLVIGGEGINFQPGWSGQAYFTCNLISGSASVGVNLQGGSGTVFEGNLISAPVAVLVAPGVSDFTFNGNDMRGSAASVIVSAGSSDYYNITSNLLHGAAAISDGGTGTHKTKTGNN